MAVTADELTDRLAAVRRRIESAGGTDDVTLVAVTKGFGDHVVRAASEVGLADLGESYADALAARAAAVAELATPPRWHFVGAIQRNKVARIASMVSLWHGVDRAAEGATIARHAPGAAVLVQVNVSEEPQKAGCTWTEAAPLVTELRDLGLDVRGLMAVGPTGDPELARQPFRRLRALVDELRLTVCSMGMTADLDVAVQEGSTMVRVGTALFGSRPRPGDHAPPSTGPNGLAASAVRTAGGQGR